MRALIAHWPEYLTEAVCLGLFMASAVTCAVLFQHPASPLVASGLFTVLRDVLSPLERLPIGLAMGLTAAALIYSPLGRRSGAHMNPAVTLAFLRLGRIERGNAAAYVAAQFLGGIAGVTVTAWLLSGLAAHPSVNYVVTQPGEQGVVVAFGAELLMSAVLMGVVLLTSMSPPLMRWTGWAAALLVALFIAVEAPLSGMSMNPARTLASAVYAPSDALWIYFTAPPLGMLAAAELAVRLGAAGRVRCARLHHRHIARTPCIFHCGHMETPA